MPAVPRLEELHGWLPHLVSSGCNGLALGPVFESSTHGYDTVDHFRVDRRLGTEQDLTELIAACHEPGIRVLLDGVFNHVGRDFPQFREVLEQGPGRRRAAWFDIDSRRRGARRVRLPRLRGPLGAGRARPRQSRRSPTTWPR